MDDKSLVLYTFFNNYFPYISICIPQAKKLNIHKTNAQYYF